MPSGAWLKDAVTFSAARKLFFRAAENTFAPDSPMTRAMLMTVLARFDGADHRLSFFGALRSSSTSYALMIFCTRA
ncbi:MAG: hypothetical protein HFF40_11075 [Lawsonibacter sp.]|nr:hypothetical protein [Lawsonibacter sp.]MCI9269378.1 hypothetical protein [Lawsonibacter sp.]